MEAMAIFYCCELDGRLIGVGGSPALAESLASRRSPISDLLY